MSLEIWKPKLVVLGETTEYNESLRRSMSEAKSFSDVEVAFLTAAISTRQRTPKSKQFHEPAEL